MKAWVAWVPGFDDNLGSVVAVAASEEAATNAVAELEDGAVTEPLDVVGIVDEVWLIARLDYDGMEEFGYTTNPDVVVAVDATGGDISAIKLDLVNDPDQFRPIPSYAVAASYDPHFDAWDHTEKEGTTLPVHGLAPAHSYSRVGKLYVTGTDLAACRKLMGEDHERLLPELEGNPNRDPLVAARNDRRIRGIPTERVASSLDNVPLEKRV